jgi:hypothetical protein
MGVCPPGFVSIHSLFTNAGLGNCTIHHATAHGTQFWLVEYPLPASGERKADQLSLGTIKNVRKTIRLTREKYHPSQTQGLRVVRGGYLRGRTMALHCRGTRTRTSSSP